MENRAAATVALRRRIVEAAVKLHTAKGIQRTRWEDIAREADLSVVTVYRHFPSLQQLIPACGELIFDSIHPPSKADAPELFAPARTPAQRVGRVADALCDFYDRAGFHIEAGRREAAYFPQVAEAQAALRSLLDDLVDEAYRPANVPRRTVRIASGLADFAVWKSLRDRGLKDQETRETIRRLLLGLLRGRGKSLSPSRTRPRRTRP
jgi:AcrR family transcriptional regulator